MATPNTKYLLHTFGYYPPNDVYAWSLERIKAARTAHQRGQLSQSAALVTQMKTDTAIYSALLKRIAPAMGLPREIVGGSDAVRSEAEALFLPSSEALDGRPTPGDFELLTALADMFEDLAMCGIVVLQNIWTPREDGSRIDVRLEPFPMSAVWWDSNKRQLIAMTTEGLVPIEHGDGKWVVVRLHSAAPWTWGAVVPLALTWPDRAFGIRDRSRSAEAHGQAHPMGELPEGLATGKAGDGDGENDEGDSQADALMETLQKLHEARRAILLPHGTKVSYLESLSQNWRIFDSLIASDDGQIERVLLGQDGSASASGGNYVKDSVLFGVRIDITERDVKGASAALTTGTLQPWEAVNHGTRSIGMNWLMPDPDEDARREAFSRGTDAFNKAISDYRSNGFMITQDLVDKLARKYRVIAPELVPAA